MHQVGIESRMQFSLIHLLVVLHIIHGLPIDDNSWGLVTKLLQRAIPVNVKHCQGLGYNETSQVNFLKQTNQTAMLNNVLFRALRMLERTGCSPIVKEFSCSLFLPKYHEKYGAIPPCRTLCNSVEVSCEQMLQYGSIFLPSYKGPCKVRKEGRFYRGKVNETKGGLTCQRWDSQTPHAHLVRPEKHPMDDLTENYCRNPDNEPEGPWCYTTSKYKRWDYCDVPYCPSRLHCHLFPQDGCVDWVLNKKSQRHEIKIIGTPKETDISNWISLLTPDNLSKLMKMQANILN